MVFFIVQNIEHIPSCFSSIDSIVYCLSPAVDGIAETDGTRFDIVDLGVRGC